MARDEERVHPDQPFPALGDGEGAAPDNRIIPEISKSVFFSSFAELLSRFVKI